MADFTDVFGGDTLFPAELSYRAVTLTANTTLQWPTEASAQTNLVAAILNVTPSAGPFAITMPPATEVSNGTAVVFNNVGANTFVVKDNGGNTILTVTSGLIWTAYVTSNTTAAGAWSTYQNGAGTSSATAAALAGYGIKAITTTLNQSMPITSTAINFTADATYRAGVTVWTGGAGIASLTAPATLGSDWFTNIKNAGTGNLVLTPLAGTIDGSTTVTLGPDESAIIVTDGVNFFTIGLTPIPTATFDYAAVSVPGSGNYTISGTELGRISYSFTGALTGVRTIIVPSTVQQYWVSNDTTGSSTGFYVKTSGQTGSGVYVAPGLSRLLRSDATNVVDAASEPFAVQMPTSSGVNAVTVTIPTFPTQYVSGASAIFVAGATNTGAVTLNVNAIGAAAVQKRGAALVSSDISLGNVVVAYYGSGAFQMISPTVALDRAQTWAGVQTFTNGIIFGNETLSTYDEGTFTAALVCGTSGSASLTDATLKYVKIGNVVFITGRLIVNTISSPVGTLTITGLPFTVFNSATNLTTGTFLPVGWAVGLTTSMLLRAIINTTTGLCYMRAATGGFVTTNIADLLANSCQMEIGLTYFTV